MDPKSTSLNDSRDTRAVMEAISRESSWNNDRSAGLNFGGVGGGRFAGEASATGRPRKRSIAQRNKTIAELTNRGYIAALRGCPGLLAGSDTVNAKKLRKKAPIRSCHPE